jgi:hypothetical protein
MKDLTASAAAVFLLALLIGVVFHWVYPTVEPSAELAGLFGFVALVLRLLAVKIAGLLRRPRAPGETEARR